MARIKSLSRVVLSLMLTIAAECASARAEAGQQTARPAPKQAATDSQDPMDAAISYLEKRREDAWKLAQEQKQRIPKDSKWPGYVGAEANQSLGFVDGVDEALSRLRKLRAMPEGAERTEALEDLQTYLKTRRENHWQQVEDKKRTVNPNFPDKFGADLNQLSGMVDALDVAMKSIEEIKTRGDNSKSITLGGVYSGPLVLRSQLSAAKGTLKLSVSGDRVTGTIDAMSRHKDGGTISQKATVIGTVAADGAIIAQVAGASKYTAGDPSEKFSSLPAFIFNYKFAGKLSGRIGPDGASGTLKLHGLGKSASDVRLTSDWILKPAP